jgi:hypothetical protein
MYHANLKHILCATYYRCHSNKTVFIQQHIAYLVNRLWYLWTLSFDYLHSSCSKTLSNLRELHSVTYFYFFLDHCLQRRFWHQFQNQEYSVQCYLIFWRLGYCGMCKSFKRGFVTSIQSNVRDKNTGQSLPSDVL